LLVSAAAETSNMPFEKFAEGRHVFVDSFGKAERIDKHIPE
jgi:hypothetical protein